MTMRNPLRLAVLTAVMLLAMIALAPTDAFAHAGHDHGGVAKAAPSENAPSSLTTRAAPSDIEGPLSAEATAGEPSHFTLAASDSSPTKSKGCTGGCCKSAGASCCPVFLPAAVPTIVPPEGRAAFAPIASTGAGITPGALSKPPKSLV
jgi:hypothetical protein